MDVFQATLKKRETYKVKLEFSLLWESAMGIAAITNKPIIDSLDKEASYWFNLKKDFSKSLEINLKIVEQNNTWKTILQLLHQKKFTKIDEFTKFILELSDESLRFLSLPYLGNEFQEERRKAARGIEDSKQKLMDIGKDNPFFSNYIKYICEVDLKFLKNHLVTVMNDWYSTVVKPDEIRLNKILKSDYLSKENLLEKTTPEKLVKLATGGVSYTPEPSVNQVLLIPQFIYRPWNIEADIENTKIFYYPVSNESINPKDIYTPNYFLVQKYKALGDEVRLKIVKFLFEKERSLQELTDQFDIAKSTVHHHLKLLKAAKLVRAENNKYYINGDSLKNLYDDLKIYLDFK